MIRGSPSVLLGFEGPVASFGKRRTLEIRWDRGFLFLGNMGIGIRLRMIPPTVNENIMLTDPS